MANKKDEQKLGKAGSAPAKGYVGHGASKSNQGYKGTMGSGKGSPKAKGVMGRG